VGSVKFEAKGPGNLHRPLAEFGVSRRFVLGGRTRMVGGWLLYGLGVEISLPCPWEELRRRGERRPRRPLALRPLFLVLRTPPICVSPALPPGRSRSKALLPPFQASGTPPLPSWSLRTLDPGLGRGWGARLPGSEGQEEQGQGREKGMEAPLAAFQIS
jgi:hypothetical protein